MRRHATSNARATNASLGALAWLSVLALLVMAASTSVALARPRITKSDPLRHGRLPHRMQVSWVGSRTYTIASSDHNGGQARTIFVEKAPSIHSKVSTRTAFAEMQVSGTGPVTATSTPGSGLPGCEFDYSMASVRANLQLELTPAGHGHVWVGGSWHPDSDVRSIVSPIAKAACDGLVPTGAGSIAQEGPRLDSGGCAGRYAMCRYIKRSALNRKSFTIRLDEDSSSGGTLLPQTWNGTVTVTFRRS